MALKVLRRHVRDRPLYDQDNKLIGWYTKPADWYIARSIRTQHGIHYDYSGLENERGFKTKNEANKRKEELLSMKK